MAQEELAHPVAPPDAIAMGVLSGPAEVPDRLVRLRGRVDLGEKPRAQQLGELARITAIRLDPLARLARDKRRGHHDARHAQGPNRALHRVAARARLVAHSQIPDRRTLELPYQAADCRRVVARLPLHRTSLPRQEHPRVDRLLLHVQTHEGGTFLHDRLFSYAALVSASQRD
jgi:hypothetical protein